MQQEQRNIFNFEEDEDETTIDQEPVEAPENPTMGDYDDDAENAPETVFRAIPPIVGGTELVKKNEEAAWTGGIPNRDYTGPMPGQPNLPVCPTQYRYFKDTGFDKRSESIPGSKLDYKTDLPKWSKGFMKAARERGFDTITYLHHPRDPLAMASIVEHPMLFKITYVRNKMMVQKTNYIGYDLANELAATNALLASVIDPIREDLTDRIDHGMSFPEVWMILMQLLTTTCIDKYSMLQDELKTMTPHSFKYQDIPKFTLSITKLARELEVVGMFEQTMVLKVLENLLTADGTSDFLHELRNLKPKVAKFANQTLFLTKEEAAKLMRDNEVSLADVVQIADDLYRTDYAMKRWPPKTSLTDAKTPGRFGANAATVNQQIATLKASLTEANALIQTMHQQEQRKQTLVCATTVENPAILLPSVPANVRPIDPPKTATTTLAVA